MTSSSSTKRPTWIGQTLGERYRIDEILGQGGMSAVYKAFDPNLKRVVAVKLIHSHLAADPEFLVRFEEEATAVAQLRHPNIVQVFDFNHDEDLYFMVQEFLAGETLQEQLMRLNKSSRRMALTDAIRYTLNICEAVGYAHKRGMIHRDIKPANIMLDLQDQAILMDFGIVKITGGEKHTATGAVVGTALYMSPELIRGETPDPCSDVYSLGVTLFEMVSGRPPFQADSVMSLMMMHLKDPVPDLTQLRPEVPDDLIAVIEKALAKDKTERFSSAAGMASALKPVLDRLQKVAVSKTEISEPQKEQDMASTQVEAVLAPPVVASTEIESRLPEATRLPQAPEIVPSPVEVPAQRVSGGPADSKASALPAFITERPMLWIAVAAAAVILILGGVLLTNLLGGNDGEGIGAAIAIQETQTALAFAAVLETATPEPPAHTATNTHIPTETETPEPSLTPTPIYTPTPTIPVGIPYSRINDISVNSQNYYIVEYETFEFTEILPGVHVHFFFNSVYPEQAGLPGSGPWYVWGGPRPFDKYGVGDRPAGATKLCILVANADHSVQLNSGNCFELPDAP